jgi:hypothetical protein
METFSQFNYDKSRLLDARYLAGMGVRGNFYDKTHVTFAAGSACMVERETYDLPPGASHPTEETAWRWSNYVNARAEIGETSSLVWIAYVQPRFRDFGDVRVLSEATLGAGLRDKLTLTATLRIRYDSTPPDGVEDLDMVLLSGLHVEF